MNDLILMPDFATKEYFHLAYRHVSDPVCLFDPASGLLVAANQAFLQHCAAGPGAEAEIQLITLTLPKEGLCEVSALYRGIMQPGLCMHIEPAMLSGDMLKLAVGIRQLSEAVREELLLAAETEKKALLNEVYHRVKNNLNIIVSLLSLQINRVSDADTRLILLESKSRIFTLSLLQQNLYSSPRISEIRTDQYLKALAGAVFSTFKPTDKQIQLLPEIDSGWLDIDILTPLGLIVHELLSNAVLHAFTDRPGGCIYLRFQQLQHGFYRLQVQDDGKGLPAGVASGANNTLGFQLIKSLSRQVNACLQIQTDSKNGTMVSLEFSENGK